jgi:hypothetical protein
MCSSSSNKGGLKVVEKLVVTRHRALYDYLVEQDIVPKDTRCIAYADASDVRDKHVYGVLPYYLACKCKYYTEVQLRLPKSVRGKELSLKDIRFLAIRPRTYKVMEVTHEGKRTVSQS